MSAMQRQSKFDEFAIRRLTKPAEFVPSLISDSGSNLVVDKAIVGEQELDVSRSWTSASRVSSVEVGVQLQSPVEMLRELMAEGVKVDVAGDIVLRYLEQYRQPVLGVSAEVAVPDRVVSGSAGTRSSRRRDRQNVYRKKCVSMALEEGMCYLKVIKWPRRVRLAAELGPEPVLAKFMRALQLGDLDFVALKTHKFRLVTEVLGAPVYHIEQCDELSCDPTVYQILSGFVSNFPFCTGVSVEFPRGLDCPYGSVPLVAVVGTSTDVSERVDGSESSSGFGDPVVLSQDYPFRGYRLIRTSEGIAGSELSELDFHGCCSDELESTVDIQVSEIVLDGLDCRRNFEVDVWGDQAVVIVSDHWFQVDAMDMGFETVVYDYGATRAVLLSESVPQTVTVLAVSAVSDASYLVVRFSDICSKFVPDLMHSFGFFIGSLQQCSGFMWADYRYNENRVPVVECKRDCDLFGVLAPYICNWRDYSYLAFLKPSAVLDGSLLVLPVTARCLFRWQLDSSESLFRTDLEVEGDGISVDISDDCLVVGLFCDSINNCSSFLAILRNGRETYRSATFVLGQTKLASEFLDKRFGLELV